MNPQGLTLWRVQWGEGPGEPETAVVAASFREAQEAANAHCPLFSGIGGLELGLERAGLGPVAWQVERDPWCRRVLAHHYPNAVRYTDVQTFRACDAEPVSVICGGFPCQDVSSAGRGAGLDGDRSGLWREFVRIVDEAQPAWVVVENVASGMRRWLPTVRRDLHVLGYDSAAVALSAGDAGAPHERRRIFVVATADADSIASWHQPERLPGRRPSRVRRQGHHVFGHHVFGHHVFGHHGEPRHAADPYAHGERQLCAARPGESGGRLGDVGHEVFWAGAAASGVRGVGHGVPERLDRLSGLGNAVVPQCSEVIGRMIVDAGGGP